MRLRTSPVFYFGIVLVLVVSAALAAPYVIDWNSYRGSLETWGQKLTGRPMRVAGKIEVTLFPIPHLTAHDVTIAGKGTGVEIRPLLRAQIVEATFSFAGLLSGGIDVEAITLTGADVFLERGSDGRGNWLLSPAQSVGESGVLDRVKLEKITLVDGTLTLHDDRQKVQGAGEISLQAINGTLSAPRINGPWKAHATAVLRDQPIDVSVSSGEIVRGTPLKVTGRLAPLDQPGHAWSIEGVQSEGGHFQGSFSAQPVLTEDGRGDADGALANLAFEAKIDATFDEITLSDIAVSNQAMAGGSSFIQGTAALDLDAGPRFDLNLKAATLDLDTLYGADFAARVARGNWLSVPATLTARWPGAMGGHVNFSATRLVAGGQTFQAVALSANVTRDTLRVGDLSARLPGQAVVKFTGLVANDAQGPQLVGHVTLDAPDLRELARWAFPSARQVIDKFWTGTRGHLVLSGTFDASKDTAHLSDTEMVLDGKKAQMTFVHDATGDNLRLDLEALDVDALVPGGIAAFSRPDKAGWTQGLAALGGLTPARPLGIVLQAEALRLNRVDATDIELDATVGPDGIALRAARLALAGGARIESHGSLGAGEQGPGGSLVSRVTADDPNELLVLLGLMPSGLPAPWARALGKTDLALTFDVAGGDEAGAALQVRGTSGAMALEASMASAGSLDWNTAEISGEATLSSPSSLALMALLGVTPQSGEDRAGHAFLSATGSVAEGFVVDVSANLFAAKVKMQFRTPKGSLARIIKGDASVVSYAPNILAGVLGAPFTLAAPIRINTDLAINASGLHLENITGVVGSSPVSGSASLSDGRVVEVQLATGSLDGEALLRGLFLAWSGSAASLDGPLGGRWPFGLTGAIHLKPEQLLLGGPLSLEGGELVLSRSATTTTASLAGKSAGGEPVQFDVALVGDGDVRRASVKVHGLLDLASFLHFPGGKPVLSGRLALDGFWTGSGRSIMGIVSTLEGAGQYSLADGALLDVSPKAFLLAAAQATQQSGIDAALKALFSPARIALGTRTGSIRLERGTLALEPVSVVTPEATLMLTPRFDMVTSAVDLGVGLVFSGVDALPPMAITFAGNADALVVSSSVDAVQSALSLRLLKKGVGELERLQQEQEKSRLDEAAQRAQDAARIKEWETRRAELARQRAKEAELERQKQKSVVIKRRKPSRVLPRHDPHGNVFIPLVIVPPAQDPRPH